MTTVAERLADARARLEAAGISSADAAFDSEVLVRHALGWDRAALLARSREPEPPDFPTRLDVLIARRIEREPVAQIVGVREFWGRDFEVTRDVLVPRPETEIVIEEALQFAREQPCRTVADVGTGSGCLAVTIASELPDVRVVATDLSQAALDVAARNARRHRVEQRIRFACADLLDGFDQRVDVIVSNPPYVPSGYSRGMQPEVIRRLFVESADRLASGGRLVVEFGFGQADAVSALAVEAGWTVLRIREDLQRIPRTIVCSRTSG
jgi:release factor glutamine methyltransferase